MLFRFKVGYVGEIEAPSAEVAKQIVCQQVSASMMLGAAVQNFAGIWEAVEVTAAMLAEEERARRMDALKLRH